MLRGKLRKVALQWAVARAKSHFNDAKGRRRSRVLQEIFKDPIAAFCRYMNWEGSLDEMYDHIFKVLPEDRTDIQNIRDKFLLIIHVPEAVILSDIGLDHILRDSFLYINILTGSMNYFRRMTLTEMEYDNYYVHSHVDSERFGVSSTICTGNFLDDVNVQDIPSRIRVVYGRMLQWLRKENPSGVYSGGLLRVYYQTGRILISSATSRRFYKQYRREILNHCEFWFDGERIRVSGVDQWVEDNVSLLPEEVFGTFIGPEFNSSVARQPLDISRSEFSDILFRGERIRAKIIKDDKINPLGYVKAVSPRFKKNVKNEIEKELFVLFEKWYYEDVQEFAEAKALVSA